MNAKSYTPLEFIFFSVKVKKITKILFISVKLGNAKMVRDSSEGSKNMKGLKSSGTEQSSY